MRIAAWNIQNGCGKRIDGIARALFEVDSDICVLSEFVNASSLRLTSASTMLATTTSFTQNLRADGEASS